MMVWKTALDVVATLSMMGASAAVMVHVWGGPRNPVPNIPSGAADASEQRRDLDMSKRPTKAPIGSVVVLEFADFECPFCGEYARQTFPAVKEAYIAPGTVRYEFVNYPLISIHPNALQAAVAAKCAERQNRFWDIHSALFSLRQPLTTAAIDKAAADMRLSQPALKNCTTDEGKELVERDIQFARAAGVDSTPTLMIGRMQSADNLKISYVLKGAKGLQAIKSAVDAVLSER
jgi:protein-disulfide isomerase